MSVAHSLYTSLASILFLVASGAIVNVAVRMLMYRDPVRPAEVERMFPKQAFKIRLLGLAIFVFAAAVFLFCYAGLTEAFPADSLSPPIIALALGFSGFIVERTMVIQRLLAKLETAPTDKAAPLPKPVSPDSPPNY